MQFRAVIYSIDTSINILWFKHKDLGQNWFTFNRRSYRLDREAVCQVLNKGNTIKGTVESLYVEGNPVPLRSELNSEDVYIEKYEEINSESVNNPQRSFWDIIFRR